MDAMQCDARESCRRSRSEEKQEMNFERNGMEWTRAYSMLG